MIEFWRQDNQSGKSKQKRDGDAEKSASDSFESSVKELQEEWVKSSTDLSISCVKVTTTDHNARRLFISPFRSLSIDATISQRRSLTSRTRPGARYVRSRINCRYSGSPLSRSMLARRSRSLLGSVQSPRYSRTCAHIASSAKVSSVGLCPLTDSNGVLTSPTQSTGGISVKAARLKIGS